MQLSRGHIPGITEWTTPQGWHVAQFHYTCDPEQRDPGWPEETRRALGYDQTDWDREMEIDWTAGLGACYFDKKALAKHYAMRTGGACYRGVMLLENKEPVFEVREGGPVWIWRLPDRIAGAKYRTRYYNRYCIGADVAEGLEKGDASAAYVMDRLRFEFVAAVYGRMSPDKYAEILNLLGRFYGEPGLGAHEVPLLGVEANNHGHTVLSDLRTKHRYPRLFTQSRGKGGERKLGWFTSSRTRPVMIDHLAKTIRERELVFHDKALVGEAMTFVQDSKGHLGATGSNHDDRVLAGAITLQMHANMPSPRAFKAESSGVFSKLRDGAREESAAWAAV